MSSTIALTTHAAKEQMPGHDCVCHECDLLVAVPTLNEGERALCPRCGHVLALLPKYPRQRPLVYALTSLIMLLCANLLPFLGINAKGMINSMNLFQAASVLFSEEYQVLSVVVFFCMQLLPLICLGLICYLFLGFRLFQRPPPLAGLATRWLFRLIAWSMVEVFLVGTLISLIKVSALAHVSIGSGFWCFCAFCVSYLKTTMHLDKGWIWEQLRGPMPKIPLLQAGELALPQGVTHCHGCEGIVSLDAHYCPRCSTPVHARIPHSIEYCVALLITSCILYIPANLLPIMVTESLGTNIYSTILGGVILLWNMGSYPVAMVIFVASVLVPIAKILALFWLCFTVSRGDRYHRRGRTRLYRLTEFVGRWSMVDVFVISILVALIRMGKLMSIYPGVAAVAFASVVVVTMTAAMFFDPRLIWDRAAR
jgi:paraquat-inducible protein A